MWRISLPRILQNNELQCLLETAVVIKKTTVLLERIILYNALCTMHTGETMHCKSCYNLHPIYPHPTGRYVPLPENISSHSSL